MAKKLFDTPDITAQFESEDIELNNRLSLLAYLGILSWLVPMFLVKQSRFAKFHANQGLVLIILNVILGIITGALNGITSLIGSGIAALLVKISAPAVLITIFSVLTTILSVLVGILSAILGIVVLFLTVVGIIYAVKGRAKELPLIGRFKIIKF